MRVTTLVGMTEANAGVTGIPCTLNSLNDAWLADGDIFMVVRGWGITAASTGLIASIVISGTNAIANANANGTLSLFLVCFIEGTWCCALIILHLHRLGFYEALKANTLQLKPFVQLTWLGLSFVWIFGRSFVLKRLIAFINEWHLHAYLRCHPLLLSG